MRVISGKYKGKKLAFPAGDTTRPTMDRVRESIFNVLNHGSWHDLAIHEAYVLDGFAGTGAFGIEALSQGAQHCLFVENDREALNACRTNLNALSENNYTVLAKSILALGNRPSNIEPRSLIFLDPPYAQGLGTQALEYLLHNGWLAQNAVIVLESAKKQPDTVPEGFTLEGTRTYGIANVQFLTLQ